jgi:hypothetical protein
MSSQEGSDDEKKSTVRRHILFARKRPKRSRRLLSFRPFQIEGTRLESNVDSDGQRGVYIYEYTLTAPDTNKASIGPSIPCSDRSRPHEQHTPRWKAGAANDNDSRWGDRARSINPQTSQDRMPSVESPLGISTKPEISSRERRALDLGSKYRSGRSASKTPRSRTSVAARSKEIEPGTAGLVVFAVKCGVPRGSGAKRVSLSH